MRRPHSSGLSILNCQFLPSFSFLFSILNSYFHLKVEGRYQSQGQCQSFSVCFKFRLSQDYYQVQDYGQRQGQKLDQDQNRIRVRIRVQVIVRKLRLGQNLIRNSQNLIKMQVFAIQLMIFKTTLKQTIMRYFKQIYCGFFKTALFFLIFTLKPRV